MTFPAGLPDSTVRLARLGQRFISSECDRLGTDHFRTRVGLRPVVCLRGPDAVRLVYPGAQVTRHGAVPASALTLLQDRGSVQTLDGPAHRRRKQLFVHLLTGDRARDLVARFAEAWSGAEAAWPRGEPVRFDREIADVMCGAAMRWAGIPRAGFEARRWVGTLAAMIDNAGHLGPSNIAARARRSRMERWARDLVRQARLHTPEDTPLGRVAAHRDLDGTPLSPEVAGVELLNLLRPIVAIGHFLSFGLLALHRYPSHRSALAAGDPAATAAFASEVRRTAPFFPMVGVRVNEPFAWHGHDFRPGDRLLVDLYGTDHDPSRWADPDAFDPDRFRSPGVDADAFVPQGGGPSLPGHRCPGEDVTVMVMCRALERLARLDHTLVTPDDVDPTRAPGLPREGVVIVLGTGPAAPVVLLDGPAAGFRSPGDRVPHDPSSSGQAQTRQAERNDTMGTATQDRQWAAALPDGDAIRILLNQHARIRELVHEVQRSHGEARRDAFEELRGFLVVHETAEEMVLRPVTHKLVSPEVADRRNAEEKEANEVLARLESLDVTSPEFEAEFATFADAVARHADAEEADEFPGIISGCDPEARRSLGKRLEMAERVAPTRPHPATAGSTMKQWTAGPFAALVDRTRDALARVARD